MISLTNLNGAGLVLFLSFLAAVWAVVEIGWRKGLDSTFPVSHDEELDVD